MNKSEVQVQTVVQIQLLIQLQIRIQTQGARVSRNTGPSTNYNCRNDTSANTSISTNQEK